MEPMAVSPPAAGQPWTPRTGWGGQWGTPLASNPGGSRTSWPQTVTPPPAQARLWGTPPPPPGHAYVATTPPAPSTIAVHAQHYPRRWVGVVDRKQQLPAAPWPSDHLCLVAAFDLTGAGPSPCKFGDRCRFFARGCCRNYHPQVPIEPLGEHNWYY